MKFLTIILAIASISLIKTQIDEPVQEVVEVPSEQTDPLYYRIGGQYYTQVEDTTLASDIETVIRDIPTENQDEYCIFGYTKLSQDIDWSTFGVWGFLVRLTENDDIDVHGGIAPGDRTLAVHINFIANERAKFERETYSGSNGNNAYFLDTIDNNILYDDYFFVYMGYSFSSQKVYTYIELSDGTTQIQAALNIDHDRQSEYKAYLGMDQYGPSGDRIRGTPGNYKGWHAGFGPGTFTDSSEGIEQFKTKAGGHPVDQPEEEKEQNAGSSVLLFFSATLLLIFVLIN